MASFPKSQRRRRNDGNKQTRKQQQSYIKDRIAVLQEVGDMLRGENKEVVLTERQRVELVGMLKNRIKK